LRELRKYKAKSNSMFSRKKKNGLPIRRRNSFPNLKIIINKKNIIYISIFLSIIVIFLSIFYYFNYIQIISTYRTNDLEYIKATDLDPIMSNYLGKPLIQINSSLLEEEISRSNPIIKNVKVSKSLIGGLVIEITEYKPIFIIQTTSGKEYIVSNEYDFIYIDSKNYSSSITRLLFLSEDLENPLLEDHIQKILTLQSKTSNYDIESWSFDNFGNLFILLTGGSIIRFDLNERFFAIDEQFSLLQDAIARNPRFREIDLRFSYYIIK
jgi:hypothetical protein